MTLKTIEEHNAERRAALRAKIWSGVACPDCGKEMMWDQDGMLLTSPPKRQAVCPECDTVHNLLA